MPTSPITPLTSAPLLPGTGTGDGATAGQVAGKAPVAGTTNAGAATAPATATAAENQHGTVSITAVVGAAGKMPAGNSTAAAANAEYLANNLAGAAHVATDLGAAKLDPDFKELPSGPLPTGTELRLRVISIQQQGMPSAITTAQANLAAAGKPTIAGQILGHTPAGHPVIHTSLGDLVLQQQANLPVGAQITLALEAVEMASAAASMTAAVTPQMTALNLAQGWPTLLDLLFTLQRGPGGGATTPGDASDPGGLAHLPQAGNKLAAGMAAAVDAFRTGDFEKLFGPLASALKATGGKQESIRKLRDEFTQLSALAQDRGNNDWRTFFLPLWDDGRLQQINLFYRRPKRGQAGDKDKDADATRFVVDVNFTRLGGCQLDGLIRKKKFDLMIRSHRELPLPVKRDIAGLFAQARELSNYAGDLSFQTTARFPVSPLDDIAKDNPTVTA